MKEPLFPITLGKIQAIQEAGIGRKLEEGEKEILELAVKVINRAYEDGRLGRGYYDLIEKPGLHRFLRSLNHWRRRAYEAGQEAKKVKEAV